MIDEKICLDMKKDIYPLPSLHQLWRQQDQDHQIPKEDLTTVMESLLGIKWSAIRTKTLFRIYLKVSHEDFRELMVCQAFCAALPLDLNLYESAWFCLQDSLESTCFYTLATPYKMRMTA